MEEELTFANGLGLAGNRPPGLRDSEPYIGFRNDFGRNGRLPLGFPVSPVGTLPGFIAASLLLSDAVESCGKLYGIVSVSTSWAIFAESLFFCTSLLTLSASSSTAVTAMSDAAFPPLIGSGPQRLHVPSSPRSKRAPQALQHSSAEVESYEGSVMSLPKLKLVYLLCRAGFPYSIEES